MGNSAGFLFNDEARFGVFSLNDRGAAVGIRSLLRLYFIAVGILNVPAGDGLLIAFLFDVGEQHDAAATGLDLHLSDGESSEFIGDIGAPSARERLFRLRNLSTGLSKRKWSNEA